MKKILLALAMFSLFLFLGCVTDTTTPEQTTSDSVLGASDGTVQQAGEAVGNTPDVMPEPEITESTDENPDEDAEELQEIEDQQAEVPDEPQDTVGNESEDNEIPNISIQDCLEDIKETNPEMSDQAANDNCYTIEAVNKNDPSLCDNVSESFKAICLSQFE